MPPAYARLSSKPPGAVRLIAEDLEHNTFVASAEVRLVAIYIRIRQLRPRSLLLITLSRMEQDRNLVFVAESFPVICTKGVIVPITYLDS